MPARISPIEQALGELADPVWTSDGWAPVFIPVGAGPMAWRAHRSSSVRVSDRHRYCEAASALTARVGLATQAALGLASAELGMRRPRLRWFRAARPNDTPDFTSTRDLAGRTGAVDFSVRVRVGLSIGESIRTVAHETRHFWQLIRAWPPEGDSRAIEADADRYVRGFWARHGARVLAQAAAASGRR